MKMQLLDYSTLAAALIFLVGCAGSSKAMQTGNSAGEVPAEENRAGRTESSPPENWEYDSMPSPQPSKTPSHRLNEIAFGDNSASLDAEGIAICRTTAAEIASMNPVRVLIVGFSHETEKDPGLGQRRANAVRQRLIGNGLASSRLETASFGSRFSGISNSPHPYMLTAAQGVEIWTLRD